MAESGGRGQSLRRQAPAEVRVGIHLFRIGASLRIDGRGTLIDNRLEPAAVPRGSRKVGLVRTPSPIAVKNVDGPK